MDEKQVQQIANDSIKDKISFLEAINRLRNIGVWGYRFDVNTHTKIFFGQNDSFVERQNYNIRIKREFSKQKVIDAIRTRQMNKIDFDEFVRQIGDAGIFDYIVDIPGKKVIYRGLFESHEEKMPI